MKGGVELNAELLPHPGSVADDMALVRAVHTGAINHDPVITFFQTGFQLAGRPGIGAWVGCGPDSGNENLPAVVSMSSAKRF